MSLVHGKMQSTPKAGGDGDVRLVKMQGTLVKEREKLEKANGVGLPNFLSGV